MTKFTYYDVNIEEIEPGIVLNDYGSLLVTPELLALILQRVQEEWGDRRIAMLTVAPSATEVFRLTDVIKEYNKSGFICASAVLVSSRLEEDLASAVHTEELTTHPRRIFTDRREAITWLRDQLSG